MRKKIAVNGLTTILTDKTGNSTTMPRCPKNNPMPPAKNPNALIYLAPAFKVYPYPHIQRPDLEGLVFTTYYG